MQAHPSDSRMYARVLREGTVRPGDPIRLEAAAGESAEAVRDRGPPGSGRAGERARLLGRGGRRRLPGRGAGRRRDRRVGIRRRSRAPPSTRRLGFAHLPNLVDRALAHFATHGVTGWVIGRRPAVAGRHRRFDARPLRDRGHRGDASAPTACRIRELPRTEIGAWADVIVAAGDFPEPIASAWRDLERNLALAAHHHRFVAEIDGRPVGAGSLHLHHHLGWLRRRSGPAVASRSRDPARAHRASRGPRATAGCGHDRRLGHRGRRVRRQSRASRLREGGDPAELPGRAGRLIHPSERGASLRRVAKQRRDERQHAPRHSAMRSTPASRLDDQPMPYCRRSASGSVESEMRCAASHATRGRQADRVQDGLLDAPRLGRHPDGAVRDASGHPRPAARRSGRAAGRSARRASRPPVRTPRGTPARRPPTAEPRSVRRRAARCRPAWRAPTAVPPDRARCRWCCHPACGRAPSDGWRSPD